jgi:NADP-dependent 3-hydroxy acid dehydrogenase YdfG
MTRELLPHWRERGSGHSVAISSLSGFASMPRTSRYAATTFGLRGFALNIREDLRGSEVGISVITPGVIRDAVRAIEHDKLEISVAPLRQRALARLPMMAPEFSGQLSGQTDKR